jgi:hypothetical protein
MYVPLILVLLCLLWTQAPVAAAEAPATQLAAVPPLVAPALQKAVPPAQPRTLNLTPFYLVQDNSGGAQVSRLTVTLVLAPEAGQENLGPDSPKLRTALYGLLHPQKSDAELSSHLKDGLKQCLGADMILEAMVQRSVLLLP